jgi:hypothetical protein
MEYFFLRLQVVSTKVVKARFQTTGVVKQLDKVRGKKNENPSQVPKTYAQTKDHSEAILPDEKRRRLSKISAIFFLKKPFVPVGLCQQCWVAPPLLTTAKHQTSFFYLYLRYRFGTK